MHLALAQLFVIFFVFISEINRKKKMTVVCPSTTRPVLNDFDWVENVGILSSFIPVEKCPSVMTHSRLCPEACVGWGKRTIFLFARYTPFPVSSLALCLTDTFVTENATYIETKSRLVINGHAGI